MIFALYLSGATESVHVVEDGNELPLIGWVEDVAINFEVLDHHIHQVSAEVQGYYVWPTCFTPLQGGPWTVLCFQLPPLLPGKDGIHLDMRRTEDGFNKFHLNHMILSIIIPCKDIVSLTSISYEVFKWLFHPNAKVTKFLFVFPFNGVIIIGINNLDLKLVQHLWCFQMEGWKCKCVKWELRPFGVITTMYGGKFSFKGCM